MRILAAPPTLSADAEAVLATMETTGQPFVVEALEPLTRHDVRLALQDLLDAGVVEPVRAFVLVNRRRA